MRQTFPNIIACILLLCSLNRPASAESAPRGPRPIQAAERAAIELVLEHLRGNADAWWLALSEGSALRALGRETALAEIAVRLGPPRESTWALATPGPQLPAHHAVFSIELASGITDLILLGMLEENGTWRLDTVRCLVDHWPQATEASGRTQNATIVNEPRTDGTRDRAYETTLAPRPLKTRRSDLSWGLSAVSLAILAWLSLLGTSATKRPLTRTGRALVLAGLMIVACGETVETVESVAPEGPTPAVKLLGDLAPLRLTLAGQDNAAMPTEDHLLPASLKPEVALWKLQDLLLRGQPAAARAAYDRLLPASSRLPLTTMVTLRLAFIEGDDVLANNAYLDMVDMSLDVDHPRIEAAGTLAVLGDSNQSRLIFEDVARAGSRAAEVYYSLAFLSALDDDLISLKRHLKRAWELRPIPRQDILGNPLLAAVAALPDTFPVFHLSNANEPIVRVTASGSQPLLLAPEEQASLVGNYLTITSGSASFEIGGGGTLAPIGTQAVDAVTARQDTWQRALEDLEETIARTRKSPGNLIRKRVMTLAMVLAQDERWSDLERLTGSITEETIDRVPPRLAKLRARALGALDQTDAARRLLVTLGLSDRAARRRDPGTLYQLADSLVDQGDYDLALKVLERAKSISSRGGRPKRDEQIRMEQALMADHRRYRKGHFEIVYPTSTGERYPTAIAAVLEAERERIGQWVPLTADGPPIEVQLYPLRTFLEAFSPGNGLLVLGLYDGRLRIPFADVASLDDRVVALMSHELTHALIARATNDKAPKWIHEGVAEHAQMKQDRLNPFPELDSVGRVLAIPVVDAALGGFADAQFVDLAYSEAAWIVHWIETRYGAGGVKRLIASFQETSDTTEAIRRAFDLSVADFQGLAVGWARAKAPQVWKTEKISYDGEFLDRVLANAKLLPPGRQPMLEVRHRSRRGDRRLVSAPERQAPKVGIHQPVATRSPQQSKAPDPLLIWHQKYTHAAARSKQVLGVLLSQRRSGNTVDTEICRNLEGALRSLRSGDALAAPDPQLRRHLESAYYKLYKAARACLDGKDAEITVSIQQAEQQLAHAARRLAPNGLRP